LDNLFFAISQAHSVVVFDRGGAELIARLADVAAEHTIVVNGETHTVSGLYRKYFVVANSG
ncbi:MAG TPA: hypothetical protein VLK84_09295, partial [Longimicrobium sp.]|nr:hypothetical protein [Longimicrobium sp.]